jgi:hypothetical protein
VDDEQDDREGDHNAWDRWCRQARDAVVTATPPLVALATLVHEVRDLLH